MILVSIIATVGVYLLADKALNIFAAIKGVYDGGIKDA